VGRASNLYGIELISANPRVLKLAAGQARTRGCRRVAGSGMRVLARSWLCELVQLWKVDHDRIRVRTGDNPDGGTVGGRVDLLVHRVRGNEDKVSWTGFNDVLQAVAPPVPRGAFQHVQDCLLIAVVVRTGRCAG
jgi:hypothetical protein